MPDVEDVKIFIDIFSDLSSMRNIGMSIGPIPFDKIYFYCQIYDIDFSMLNYLMRMIDNMYLDYLNELEKQRSSNGKESNTNNG